MNFYLYERIFLFWLLNVKIVFKCLLVCTWKKHIWFDICWNPYWIWYAILYWKKCEFQLVFCYVCVFFLFLFPHSTNLFHVVLYVWILGKLSKESTVSGLYQTVTISLWYVDLCVNFMIDWWLRIELNIDEYFKYSGLYRKV